MNYVCKSSNVIKQTPFDMSISIPLNQIQIHVGYV